MRPPALFWLSLAALLTACAGADVAGRCLQLPVSNKVSRRALKRCRVAFRGDVDRRDVFDRYAQLLRSRGRYRALVKICRRVLAHDGKRTDARFFLAVGLRKLGRCGEALGHYRAYAKANPEDPDPHFGIGLCARELGRQRDAVAAFRRYLSKEHRDHAEPWRRRAQTLLASLGAGGARAARPGVAPPAAGKGPGAGGRPAAKGTRRPARPAAPPSCTRFERAIKADPFNTKAYDGFAACAAKRGEHAAIVKRMRIAIRDNPDYARGWLHLGRAHRALGAKAEAVRALARACKAQVPEACAE